MILSDIGDELDVSAEGRAIVERQLERIFAHGSFRNSKRCRAFLRYVVEEKLNGNGIHLKERMIGIAVFQQPLDYDTNANSVVRVTAGEVRRRLAQYYVETDLHNEALIALPLGSYVPEFRINGTAVLHEIALQEPARVILPEYEEPDQPALQVAVAMSHPPRWFSWNLKVLIPLLVCGLLVEAAVIVATARGRHGTNESDRIWTGAFHGENVLLCAGSLYSFPDKPINANGQPVRPQYTSISFTTARTAAVIGSAIGHVNGETSLLPAQDVKVEDLERTPVTLIGAYNNEWTMRLQSPLRYQFSRTSGMPDAIVDTTNPNGKRFIEENHLTKDYGIFAHFTSPTTGQPTVIVAGIGMHGTAAVRIFLSSPELLKEFAKAAPAGWEKRNYEILLSSDLVNNLAAPPTIVDAYFW